MFSTIARRIFGTANDRLVRKLKKAVDAINALEPAMVSLSDEQLKSKTHEFKQRLSNGASVDDLLPEAFAVVREASKRVLGMRPFDVQLMGGMILHRGMIPEMKTGEGKTLVSTLPAYLNGLTGKGVHIVTVNDYLAQRDSSNMGRLHTFLGLTVGCITHEMDDHERKEAYNCDITYGTNNEFGFDYLRDNMKFSLIEMVQRSFNYAIVDEVDSILIDEARTPLIISGPAEDSSDLYTAVDHVIPHLTSEDYDKDEKSRTVLLTEAGTEKVETLLRGMNLLQADNLYDPANIALVHHMNQALRAHKLFSKDTDYIVKDNKVIIIDEFTGRMMDGRRYSDGLHQALEAKERVKIQVENQTLASITFQNYFRLYHKLAGMTGTAMTEATEFNDIYKLEVVEIPTNVPCVRLDKDDEVYRTSREKYDAIIKLIEECHARKQPVLVGTVSIEKSEYLSQLLTKKKLPHQVLNARYHEQEALIIAEAGYPGAVTIATNMAGRGTDIQLGGNLEMRVAMELAKNPATAENAKQYEALLTKTKDEIRTAAEIVKNAGGLYVIGTERHESRRIDNQLRGRAGRQGDPGASKFFLSLEDDLMRIFGSERLDSMLQRLGLQEGEAIAHAWINKALERAQRKVEARNYDIRKQLLKFDDVMNDQRKVIYEQRREIMSMEHLQEAVSDMRHEMAELIISRFAHEDSTSEQWDIHALHQECIRVLNVDLPIQKWVTDEDLSPIALRDRILEASEEHMRNKEEQFGTHAMRHAEQSVLLQFLDQAWKEHLLALDHLRQGINLRAYGQRDPLNEYKSEAFNLFKLMMGTLRENVTTALSHIEINPHYGINPAYHDSSSSSLDELKQHFLKLYDEEQAALNAAESTDANVLPIKPKGALRGKKPKDIDSTENTNNASQELQEATSSRRNELCPCGSGLKFKHCHGKID
ncbi:MAG: preprotein translocase subunit SecA [Alphaproteobacteria bacterium]|nr:preprotein translocase subunit SecA [Alphaproteobacteria bacterium]OJV45714.1 MAG: preprotein translocase subunit SecA [Alphaproteobacteria bacterium 43-37]